MRNKYLILYGIAIISFLVTLWAIAVFPDTIPLQYDNGGVSRFGSKYELLIISGIFAFIELGMIIYGRHEAKKGRNGTNEKPVIYSGIAVSIFFMALQVYFVYITYRYCASNEIAFNMETLSLIVCIGLGIALCLTGNVLPKTSRNSFMGFHTLLSNQWAASDDDIWKKTQRFCGISFVICGIVIILGAIILNNYARLLFAGASVGVTCIVSYIASIYICKKFAAGIKK